MTKVDLFCFFCKKNDTFAYNFNQKITKFILYHETTQISTDYQFSIIIR